MKKLSLSMFFVLTLLFDAFGYETNVHGKITEKAIESSNIETYLKNNLKISLTNKFDGQFASKWLELGSNWEDNNPRWLNHFYDPTTGKGLSDMLSGRPSLEWARDYWSNDWNWKKTRQFYYFALTKKKLDMRVSNFASLFRSLGQIIHLVEDLTVPAHVRNDAHPYQFENYLQQQRDMYEKYTRNAARGDNGYTQLKYDGYPAVDLAIFNNFDTFWVNGGKGIAEFTNKNFLSRDTNIDDAKYQAPVPIGEWITKETIIDPWMGQMEFDVKYFQGYVTDNYRPSESKPLRRLAAYSYFDFEMEKYGYAQRVYSLNNKIHQEYASLLLPRAVGYSAGLLNYFFRGDIRLEHVTSSSLGYVIVNNTYEDLSGLFQVFYDDSSDQRTEITNKQLSIAKKGRSNVFDIATPDNAKEPGKYILVFKGTMGNETGAVAGYVYTGGTLEVTPPSGYVYAIIDGSEEPQQFTKLKAKIRNKTDKEIGAGTLQATARYKTRTDYMPDLSSDPPDISSREEGYSYSCSAMVSVSSLSSESAAEILFDFKSQPIPAGITDLELFVNFNGTIGVESGVVTGKKDLSEPTHHLFWNLTDRFSLYGKLYTNLEILEDPELVKFADLDGNGFYDETEKGEPYIDPHPVTLKIAYYEGDPPEGSLQEAAVVEKMPEGRHIRLISLFDRQNENKLRLTWVDDIYQVSIPYKYIFTASRNQSEGGEFIVTRPGEFRTLRSHLSQGVLNCEPAGTNPETGNNYCTYPKAQEEQPEIITPYPAMIKFP